jgi:hypothetical protein
MEGWKDGRMDGWMDMKRIYVDVRTKTASDYTLHSPNWRANPIRKSLIFL